MLESQDAENAGPIANLHENTRLSVSGSFATFKNYFCCTGPESLNFFFH